VFLSVGHDEYWSGDQRANVEAARDAGTHLGFFSGNEVFWKTRWEAGIDASGASYRTLVSYKETHENNVVDPANPIWTGTWRDPRFSPPADGGRPENELTGTIFFVNAGATTEIRVPAADGNMRFWRNTRAANQSGGATEVLADSTLGYEWDVDLDNGFRPPGLIRLSTTTVGNAPILLDYGSTYGNGLATHHLTLYKHQSGALVFGAGTVQWSWGLDDNHDRNGGPPDAAMQQATVNLLADMNTQPGTLQAGLSPASSSTDATTPTSEISQPTGGSNVPVGVTVNVSGTASDSGGGVVGGVEVSVDGGATWHPAAGRESWSYSWTPQSEGPVSILSRAVDDSGNLEVAGPGVQVSVGDGDTTPPSVVGVSPGGGAVDIAIGTTVTATFDEAMDPASIDGTTVVLQDGGGTAVPATVAYDAGTLTATLTPSAALDPSTTYTATVQGSNPGGPPVVTDAAGNALVNDESWSFTTAAPDSSGCPCSFWDDTVTPTLLQDPDTSALELGLKFQSDSDGQIVGIRFYKSTANTGTHLANLWSSTGQSLAQATFTNETGSGWQTVLFATPVSITANTTYVASYHTAVGAYSVDENYFAGSGFSNGSLRALFDGEQGGNGVYQYGASSFPTNTFRSSNYWVDVLFVPTAGP
jgi:hypothetical protein